MIAVHSGCTVVRYVARRYQSYMHLHWRSYIWKSANVMFYLTEGTFSCFRGLLVGTSREFLGGGMVTVRHRLKYSVWNWIFWKIFERWRSLSTYERLFNFERIKRDIAIVFLEESKIRLRPFYYKCFPAKGLKEMTNRWDFN